MKAIAACAIAFGLFSSAFARAGIAVTDEPMATASEVLVVYNSAITTDSNSDTVQDSLEIAEYYKAARSIPAANVVGIAAPVTAGALKETITRSEYNTGIKDPIESYLVSSGLKDTIKYVVLAKGMPLRINGTDYSSVDAAVCLLFQTYVTTGKIANPYYQSDSTGSDFSKRYRFKANNVANVDYAGNAIRYLTTRLDGYTVADVKGMIDRAVNTASARAGYYLIDDKSDLSYDYMSDTYSALVQHGFSSTYDNTNSYLTSAAGPVLGYVGHGIHAGMPQNYYYTTLSGLTYGNGAVSSTYESYNGVTFASAGGNWGQGLVADFIATGGSGGIGNVEEPLSSAIAIDRIMLTLYAMGYSWADAAYQSLFYMDWQSVVVGDPLMTIGDNAPTSSVSGFGGSWTSASAFALSWTNPADIDYGETVVMRKIGSVPASPFDGSEVYRGTAVSYEDTGLSNANDYYYAAFAVDGSVNYSAAATLRANDVPSVSFSSSTSSASESVSSHGVAVSLSSSYSADVSVSYAVTGGTASSGTDYVLASGTLTIPAGSTTVDVPLVATDDAAVEGDETVIVAISSPTNATLGATASHTHTITDNDVPSVSFSSSTSSASESVSSHGVAVSLSSSYSADVSVSYAVTGGTASSGTDYVLASGTLTIPAGSTTADVPLVATDDAAVEGDETVIVAISSPTNATLGATASHTHTITDNDAASVTFYVASASGSESVPSYSISIRLSVAAPYATSVVCAVTGGTASAGTDFSLAGGTVSFLAGETEKTVSLSITDDSAYESDETAVISLSGPSGLALGGNPSFTYTIVNNDSAPSSGGGGGGGGSSFVSSSSSVPASVPSPVVSIPTALIPVDVMARERELSAPVPDMKLANRLKGRIVLQIQESGEAWYVNPKDGTKFYLKDGPSAYGLMRSAGLGITDADLAKIPKGTLGISQKAAKSSLGAKLSGRIVIQVQRKGEAWYVNPVDGRRYYMKDGDAAYDIMRKLGLGITNGDLRKIPVEGE